MWVGALALLSAAAGPAMALAVGLVVAEVGRASVDGWSGQTRAALVFVGAATTLQVVLPPFLSMASASLGRRVDHESADRLLTGLLAVRTIAHLDDPSTRNELAQARGHTGTVPPGPGVQALVTLLSTRAGGGLAALVVARIDWPIAALLVGVQLATMRFWARFYRRLTSWATERTPDLRRGDWFRDNAMGPAAAKEIRIFGLGDWFADRFHQHWGDGMTKVWAAWKEQRWSVLLAVAAPAVATFAALVVIANDAGQSASSVSAALAAAQAVLLVGQLGGAADSARIVAAAASGVRAARQLNDAWSHHGGLDTGDSDDQREALRPGVVRFDDVGFRYPATKRWVVRHLDLELRPEESLALVGINGAGKTTIVKLLAGLVDPTEGSISIDGRPLASVDVDEWRRQVAVILQDFVHYEMSAADNVCLTDDPLDRELLDRVAALAGASELVAELPAGWETPLSARVTGGVGLSGGQWQRIALARALMAVEQGAWLLVLDEPTAALDVRAEVALYDRFLEITSGVTTLVISHRFSTVRHADRIVVLDDGRVIEEGTHEALIALRGQYATMFDAQAARFQSST